MMDRVGFAMALRAAYMEGGTCPAWENADQEIRNDWCRVADKAMELLDFEDTAKPDPAPVAPDTPEPSAGPIVVVNARPEAEYLARIARLRAALRRAVTIAGDALDGNL